MIDFLFEIFFQGIPELFSNNVSTYCRVLRNFGLALFVLGIAMASSDSVSDDIRVLGSLFMILGVTLILIALFLVGRVQRRSSNDDS